MTKEITQEERLDLNNVKEEAEAYTKSMDIKEIMKQNIPDLLAENQRLKLQLDREIKINRIMKKALEKYADMSNWFICYLRHHYIFQKDNYKANELAQQVLKEIDNKE